MSRIFNISLTLTFLTFGLSANADDHNKVLFKDLVAPILNAKCGGCHGEEKQKGKLRLDSLEAIMKGGSEGVSVVAGKVDESSLVGRVKLPLDDDEHMPPEGKPQLTKEESAVLAFWIQSGAKGDATIAQLKPAGEVDAAIKVVIANPPKAAGAAAVAKVDPAKMKAAEATIETIGKSGASLMAIAQNTPDLRFSALNVAREYNDKNLEQLKPVADQVKWMDLARTQVTDAGMAHVAAMKNLTRLHLENTKVTDAGLDQLKGLANLEYLNLYGTQVTDAGLAKLNGLKKLKKVFVWQTKVTDAGAKKLIAAIPGISVNTGWKEPAPAKPVVVAAAAPKTPPAPAKKPATPAPAAPAKKPAPAPTTGIPALDKAIAELKVAVAETAKQSAAAAKGATDAATAAKAATDAATKAKAAMDQANVVAADAKAALEMLEKAAKGSPKVFEKAVTELKAAAAMANQAAAEAKKKSDAAVAAAGVAAKKIETEKAKAAKIAETASKTKAALDILLQTPAIAG